MKFVYESDENGNEFVKEMWMVRGDDEVIAVSPGIMLDGVLNENGYSVQDGDVITLTVRETPDDEAAVLMRISSAPGVMRIPIRHEDTEGIPYGQYSADIELVTADGYHKTIWPILKPERTRAGATNLKNFNICSEVTF